MDKDTIIQIITLILSAIFGTGGLCAFIITIVKLNKKSNVYFTRCQLAAKFIKTDIVKVEPPEAKQLMIDILEGKVDESEKNRNKLANKILKEAAKANK